jgi:hypothetical protein
MASNIGPSLLDSINFNGSLLLVVHFFGSGRLQVTNLRTVDSAQANSDA